MLIADVLSPEGVICGIKPTSKKQLLQEISAKAAILVKIDERAIFDVLVERERLGTTGVGNGVAIPHGRINQMKNLSMMFVKLDTPIAFDSVDNRPVDLLFLLLAPESAGADHLKALAKASRILRDEALCQKLRGCDTKESIYLILTEADQAAA